MTVHRATSNAKKGEPGHTVGTREVPAMSSGTPGTARGGDQLSAQFLLAEFNTLQERAQGYEHLNTTRVNFFLIAVAAVIGGLATIATIANSTNLPFDYNLLTLGGFLGLLFVGLATLKNVMDYSGMSVVLYRRAGRIRRWFVERDRGLRSYVAFEPTDALPPFTTPYLVTRGAEAALLIINAALAVALSESVLGLGKQQGAWVHGVALVIGLVVWGVQQLYIHVTMKRAENAPETRIAILHPPMDAAQ
jgi:hypothetical protein